MYGVGPFVVTQIVLIWIENANKKVSALLASTSSSSMKDDRSGQRSCGSYMKFTPEQKAQVARYMLESGNKRAIMKYSQQ